MSFGDEEVVQDEEIVTDTEEIVQDEEEVVRDEDIEEEVRDCLLYTSDAADE